MAEFRVKRGQNCAECGRRIVHLARYNYANQVVHATPSCPKEVTHAPSDI